HPRSRAHRPGRDDPLHGPRGVYGSEDSRPNGPGTSPVATGFGTTDTATGDFRFLGTETFTLTSTRGSGFDRFVRPQHDGPFFRSDPRAGAERPGGHPATTRPLQDHSAARPGRHG